jgi:D-amino-acid dehydrogenase
MKVTVLGGGVIGVAAAYYLMADGHEVAVVEAREGCGLETSFANGGQLVASHAEPWASPATLRLMLKWLGRRDAPIILRLRATPALIGWGLRFLRNCTSARAADHTARNLRLGLANRALMRALRDETGITYDAARTGALTLFRDARTFEAAARHAEVMAGLGCATEVAGPARTVAIEPALGHLGDRIAGGLFEPGDELGDCHKFTAALAAYCAARGVAFHYDTRVTGIAAEGDRIASVATDKGALAADATDAYVLAAGPWSARLARPLGLRLPVTPVKGYALTAAIADEEAAPRVGVTDHTSRVVFARLGARLRVVSTAEFAGFDASLNARRLALMEATARALLPGAAEYEAQEVWSGLRPATPDNVPILGPTKYRNLWLDTGHGTLGWTQACASGRLVADLIAGRDPGIDLKGLTLARF